MLINRYKLLKYNVSKTDIRRLQNRARNLKGVEAQYLTTNSPSGRIFNSLFFDLDDMIKSLENYSKEMRADFVDSNKKLINVLKKIKRDEEEKEKLKELETASNI